MDSKSIQCGFESHRGHRSVIPRAEDDGRASARAIALTGWQQRIVETLPGRFLRGLFHSDGCRTENRIERRGKSYVYPRYMFTNKSADIMRLCQEALDGAGVPWRMCSSIQLSVARREGVLVLDGLVGAKR